MLKSKLNYVILYYVILSYVTSRFFSLPYVTLSYGNQVIKIEQQVVKDVTLAPYQLRGTRVTPYSTTV